MSEKYNELFKALKEQNLISLYYNRVMFYNEGYGEIQFWNLEEISENVLCLKNKGVWVFFDRWEFSETPASKSLHVYNGELETAEFKFPSEKKLISVHNHFYVDEFTVEMANLLDANVAQKGDWTLISSEAAEKGLKHNLGKLKKSTEIEEFKKSCVDLANYAFMSYFLAEKWRQLDETNS